jgi:ribosomal protein S18 acetylase RimI-like enzyme
MNNLTLKNITNEYELKKFIESCKEETKSFRYFSNRPYDIFKTHICSYLLYLNDAAIGYYHIENENNINWFGICISKKYQGYGIGSFILNHMISTCKLNNIEKIHLSVDINNSVAINLYNKFNFKIKKVNEFYLEMIKEF